VSGEIAGKVGAILKNMGKTMQVIVITHLPQIAGKGDAHYMVYKENDKKNTRSNIRRLKENERVLEIAKMLSNENVSESAYRTAQELMKK
jgi:DNA repair protein RecN (Recombination protein N)